MREWKKEYIITTKEMIARRKRRIAEIQEEEESLLEDIKDYERSIDRLSEQKEVF